MKKVAIIGAGPMGLACANALINKNFTIDIYESDDRIGGMSAHFDFDGLSIERYYHFICKPDDSLFQLLAELDLSHKLKWQDTAMGYYFNGKLYKWGTPAALLKFSPLGILDRLRYGLQMFISTKIRKWEKLDSIEASEWIKKWIGNKAYDILWRRLFELKFFHYANNLSAAWIWARIRRVGRSRKNLFQEQMGYLEGGSETLLNALQVKLRSEGVNIYLNEQVNKVTATGNVKNVKSNSREKQYDIVISTIPMPFVPNIISGLGQDLEKTYRSFQNIGVVCLLFKLSKKITENFWLNISDKDIEIPGIIEYTNLRPMNCQLVYVPFYLPRTHPKFKNSDKQFVEESVGYLKKLNPELNDKDILNVHVSRYGYAQPICQPNFLKMLPDMETNLPDVYVVDTSFYYPEDRSISESVKLGVAVAKRIISKQEMA